MPCLRWLKRIVLLNISIGICISICIGISVSISVYQY